MQAAFVRCDLPAIDTLSPIRDDRNVAGSRLLHQTPTIDFGPVDGTPAAHGQRPRPQSQSILAELRSAGLYKTERPLAGPQGGHIAVAEKAGRRELLNLCANNYLGLADHPEIIAAARDALDSYGFGMASVRFICGTQTLHRELEQRDRRLSRQGRRDPLRRLLRRQWRRCSSRCSARRTRSSPMPQPRLDHRRHPALQGQALPLRQNGDMNELEDQLKEADRNGATVQDDRHRRRLLDGRLCRQARRRSAPSPTATTRS